MAVMRVRVVFFRPDEFEAVASVWADLDAANLTLTMLHDYGADLTPAPGWTIIMGAPARVGGLQRFAVTSVNGRVLGVLKRGAQ